MQDVRANVKDARFAEKLLMANYVISVKPDTILVLFVVMIRLNSSANL